MSNESENLRPYDQGMLAAEKGAEFYENPHMEPKGSRNDALAWFAGWCFAKKEVEAKSKKAKL